MKEKSRGRKMCKVRAQVLLVHKLQEQLHEITPRVSSIELTGMPKNSGRMPRGLDVQLAKKDALERMLEREGALLREYEAEAREEMEKMRPDYYAFCAMYYLSGLSIADTAEMLERSERQCMRYRREIEGETTENKPENART